jgi:hypothetical protein
MAVGQPSSGVETAAAQTLREVFEKVAPSVVKQGARPRPRDRRTVALQGDGSGVLVTGRQS